MNTYTFKRLDFPNAGGGVYWDAAPNGALNFVRGYALVRVEGENEKKLVAAINAGAPPLGEKFELHNTSHPGAQRIHIVDSLSTQTYKPESNKPTLGPEWVDYNTARGFGIDPGRLNKAVLAGRVRKVDSDGGKYFHGDDVKTEIARLSGGKDKEE